MHRQGNYSCSCIQQAHGVVEYAVTFRVFWFDTMKLVGMPVNSSFIQQKQLLCQCWKSDCLIMSSTHVPYHLKRHTAVCRRHRQKRNVTLVILETTLQWLNLFFYVLPNALNVADPCYEWGDLWFWFGFARWTCWNTVSCLDSIAVNSSSGFSFDSTITSCAYYIP